MWLLPRSCGARVNDLVLAQRCDAVIRDGLDEVTLRGFVEWLAEGAFGPCDMSDGYDS